MGKMKSALLTVALFFAAITLCRAQTDLAHTSISYGYNSKLNVSYYYALSGNTLYYQNVDNQNKWHWYKMDADPFPAPYGFIAVAIDSTGNRSLYALGSDGYLYELHYSNLDAAQWIKVRNVERISGAPTCLAIYLPKDGNMQYRTMVGGRYYQLTSPDGKTNHWEELDDVSALSGGSTALQAGADKDGNGHERALADGKLYLLNSKDNGKTYTWDAWEDTDTLPPGPASFTFYYDEKGSMNVYAMVNGEEYDLRSDDKGHNHWQRTDTPALK